MFLTETSVNLWHTYGPFMKVLCCCFVCLMIQRKKNRWFLWWSAWFNHGVGPSSKTKKCGVIDASSGGHGNTDFCWEFWWPTLMISNVFLLTRWLNTNYDITKPHPNINNSSRNMWHMVFVYIYISRVQLGCCDSWCCGVISNFENKNAKKKRTFSWTTTLHSGRWTAGTYSHHPPIFKGKMIWTKPPGNYVPC